MKRWLSVAIALGLYLTLRGYHSRDGDQAYRLPLLLHGQDNAVYANDPFVRAFDQVNPHRGYLATYDTPRARMDDEYVGEMRAPRVVMRNPARRPRALAQQPAVMQVESSPRQTMPYEVDI